MPSKSPLSSLSASLLLGIFLLPLAATLAPPAVRAAQGSEDEPFTETVDVRVINVEAVVEDDQGNRVQGLGIGDFELLVDGKPQPVEYFSEIRGNVATAAATPAPAAPAAAPAPAPPPGLDEGGRLPTCYVIFVDLSSADPRYVKQATENLARQVESIPAEDKVALFVFDGRRLDNLADWRDRRRQVVLSLESLYERATGLQAVAEDRAFDLARERLDSRVPQLNQDVSNNLEDGARRLGNRIAASFTALATIMRTAEPPPGRRVILAFGGSWPRDLAAHFGVAEGRNGLARRLREYYPLKSYTQVYETANLMGYTFYGADLYSNRKAAGSAEVFGSPDIDGADASRLDNLREQDRDFERDATLMRYAEQTGGKAFTTGFGETTLATLQQDLASFYWLGFTAKKIDKDKDHSIEVRVKRPGLKVRSRKQFSDLSRKVEIDQELDSRLLFSSRASEDFTVVLSEPERKRSEMTVPITFRIPLDKVVFLPKGKGYAAELEMRVAAIDDRGQRSPMPNLPPVKLEGPKPQLGQYATYETQLRLNTAARRVVLGLYDKAGDRLLVSTIDLEKEVP